VPAHVPSGHVGFCDIPQFDSKNLRQTHDAREKKLSRGEALHFVAKHVRVVVTNVMPSATTRTILPELRSGSSPIQEYAAMETRWRLDATVAACCNPVSDDPVGDPVAPVSADIREICVSASSSRNLATDMNALIKLIVAFAVMTVARADNVKHDIPYAEPANKRQMLDIYAPDNAKNLPVVFWIHGGGWQAGDKTAVQVKPKAFVDKGYIFVSTNYRFLPNVDMKTIVRDIARSIHWVHYHIAEHGGDPKRLLVMGHSAGAQLAALICTDERYLKAEGVSPTIIKGCVPVDGDTYDVPLIIETAAARRKALGQPDPKFGHYEKFGGDPVKQRDFSAVNHVARDKSIPPFLLLFVADHPDTSAQAVRLKSVLTDAGISTTLFGAENSEHSRINENLGRPGDPATRVLFEFADKMAKLG
jgi:arylformamidase